MMNQYAEETLENIENLHTISDNYLSATFGPVLDGQDDLLDTLEKEELKSMLYSFMNYGLKLIDINRRLIEIAKCRNS